MVYVQGGFSPGLAPEPVVVYSTVPPPPSLEASGLFLGPFVIPGRAVCVSVNQSPVDHVSRRHQRVLRSLEAFCPSRRAHIRHIFRSLYNSIWETLGSQCIVTKTLWKHIFRKQYFQPSVDSLLQSPSTCLKGSENSLSVHSVTSQRVVFQHGQFWRMDWAKGVPLWRMDFHHFRWVHWHGS